MEDISHKQILNNFGFDTDRPKKLSYRNIDENLSIKILFNNWNVCYRLYHEPPNKEIKTILFDVSINELKIYLLGYFRKKKIQKILNNV